MQHLGPARVAEPGTNRLLGRVVEPGHVDVCRRAVRRGNRHGRHVTGAAGPGAHHVQAHRVTGAGVLLQPARHVGRPEGLAVDLEPRLGLLLGGLDGGEQPVAQHPELQAVEHRVDLFAVPVVPGELVDAQREGHVTDQRVEPAVAQHAVEVRPQRLARLALDLVDMGDDAGEVAVLR